MGDEKKKLSELARWVAKQFSAMGFDSVVKWGGLEHAAPYVLAKATVFGGGVVEFGSVYDSTKSFDAWVKDVRRAALNQWVPGVVEASRNARDEAQREERQAHIARGGSVVSWSAPFPRPEPREVVCDDPANDEPLTDEQRKAVEAYWRARIFDPSDYRK